MLAKTKKLLEENSLNLHDFVLDNALLDKIPKAWAPNGGKKKLDKLNLSKIKTKFFVSKGITKGEKDNILNGIKYLEILCNKPLVCRIYKGILQLNVEK